MAEKLGKEVKKKINDFKCIVSTPNKEGRMVILDLPFRYKIDENNLDEFINHNTLDMVDELNRHIKRFKSSLYPFLTRTISTVFKGVKNDKIDHIKDLLVSEPTSNTTKNFINKWNYARLEVSIFILPGINFTDVQPYFDELAELLTVWLVCQNQLLIETT